MLTLLLRFHELWANFGYVCEEQIRFAQAYSIF